MYQAGTLVGQPAGDGRRAGDAAHAEPSQQPGVFDSIADHGTALVAGIEAAAQAHGIPIQAGRVGTMFGFYFLKEPGRDHRLRQRQSACRHRPLRPLLPRHAGSAASTSRPASSRLHSSAARTPRPISRRHWPRCGTCSKPWGDHELTCALSVQRRHYRRRHCRLERRLVSPEGGASRRVAAALHPPGRIGPLGRSHPDRGGRSCRGPVRGRGWP